MNLEVSRESTPILSFDSNPYLKGIEHLAGLYHAIKNKTVLKITYQDFLSPEPYDLIIHPYFLKQYNQRWFLFGLNEENQNPAWNLAIDRIHVVTEISRPYQPNRDIDWTEYFDDIIGVTKPPDAEPETVVLHFYGISGKYVENKPIHGSQKTKWLEDGVLEVQLQLIPNYELERLILSHGEHVKVIHPKNVRDSLLIRTNNLLKILSI